MTIIQRVRKINRLRTRRATAVRQHRAVKAIDFRLVDLMRLPTQLRNSHGTGSEEMSLATAIRDASYVIKACSSWIASAAAQGGFAMDGSMSAVDLENAERELRGLADRVAEQRAALLDNVPTEYGVAA